MITLYSTHCPKCIILEKKLREKNIDFEIWDDVDLMLEKGFQEAPYLEIQDDASLGINELLNFSQAISKLNTLVQ